MLLESWISSVDAGGTSKSPGRRRCGRLRLTPQAHAAKRLRCRPSVPLGWVASSFSAATPSLEGGARANTACFRQQSAPVALRARRGAAPFASWARCTLELYRLRLRQQRRTRTVVACGGGLLTIGYGLLRQVSSSGS